VGRYFFGGMQVADLILHEIHTADGLP